MRYTTAHIQFEQRIYIYVLVAILKKIKNIKKLIWQKHFYLIVAKTRK
jgi:hypothetical protein